MIIGNSVIEDNCLCENDDELTLYNEYIGLLKTFTDKIGKKYSVYGEFTMYPEKLNESNYGHNIVMDLSVCKNHVNCGIEFVMMDSYMPDIYNPWSIALAKEPQFVIELLTPDTCYIEGSTVDFNIVNTSLELLKSVFDKYSSNVNGTLKKDISRARICIDLLDKLVELRPSLTEFMIDLYYNYTIDLRVIKNGKCMMRTFKIRKDNSHIIRNFEKMLVR